ncbi:MAG: hypothetical protein ACRC1K_17715, partial [Planctomycetia bacterium]
VEWAATAAVATRTVRVASAQALLVEPTPADFDLWPAEFPPAGGDLEPTADRATGSDWSL